MNAKIQALGVGFGLCALLALGSWALRPAAGGTAGGTAGGAVENTAASVESETGGGAPAMEGGPGTNRPAPPVALTTFDGKPWSLAAARGKQPALLVFWASWCTSCRAEAPHVDALFRETAGKLAVAGINVQDRPDPARAFVKDLGLGYPMLDDPGSAVAQAYGIRALPTLVLVDKAGTIRWQGHQLPPTEAITAFL